MKIKKLTTALLALGFTSSVAFAAGNPPPGITPFPDEGPNPKKRPYQEASAALTEVNISGLAALITMHGCDFVYDSLGGGATTLYVESNENGTGESRMPDVGNFAFPFRLEILTPQPRPEDRLGAKYHITQVPGNYINVSDDLRLRNWAGDLDFSTGGAIMISDSTFELDEYVGAWWEWDEVNIKDFWVYDKSYHIKDAGLEVITKLGYPQSKWRQYSDHIWWNAEVEGEGSVDIWKWLITPYDKPDAYIHLVGTILDGSFGSHVIKADITVECIDQT